MYPADLPAGDDTDLRPASEQYLSSLEVRPQDHEWFQSSQTSKVAITASNVSWLKLFKDDKPECAVLALHPPDHPTQVVALYLHGRWWRVADVLRTCSKSRSGLMSVQSLMERVIVFLLSQVVERPPQEDLLFLPHSSTESCKLLWLDSQAVGFYSVKHKGSLCDSWSSRCYLLPVLDTVMVRRSWRRRGFCLHMLDDFCSSFSSEEVLGVSAPLSPSMAAVCRRFLQLHEDQRERLYEVEAPGGWTLRRNIWLNIQLGRYSLGVDEQSKPDAGAAAHIQEPAKLCDPSGGGTSPSSKISGTGCVSAAPARDLDSGHPIEPPETLNMKQALKSKPSSSGPHRETPEAEETQGRAKRVRRT